MDKILGNEDLVEINANGFFVVKLDPDTQEFKKVLYDTKTNSWKMEDLTDPDYVAKKVVDSL